MGSATGLCARTGGWLFAVLLLALVCAMPAGAAPFGVEPGSFSTLLSGDYAGEHADLTATFTFTQEPAGTPTGYAKDLGLHLPPGLIANPASTPHCDMGEVLNELCPSEDAVGIAEITTSVPPKFKTVHKNTVFVYNIEPYPNEPAAFALLSSGSPLRLDTSLPGNGGYGLAMSATDISDVHPLISVTVTLWGVPADHNGPVCHINEATEEEECVKFGGPGEGARMPFLSNPVACTSSPLESTLSGDTWQEEGFVAEPSAAIGEMTECESVKFAPSVVAKPEELEARKPVGYEVAVHLPSDQSPDDRAVGELRSVQVSLPAGTAISPSAGHGLEGCSEAQFEAQSAGEEGSAECPPGSRIGSVTIATPVVGGPLSGQLFLGIPECAPCTASDAQQGKMIRLLLQAAGSGVLVKLHGSIVVNELTGQLTARIENAPQLPVEELKLNLNSGPRALLANPAECSTTLKGSAQLTPYSSPIANEVAGPDFQLTGCGGPQFAPAFSAGTVSNQAGSSSPALVTIGRVEQDQTLERFAVRMPPGLLGLLSKVPTCPASVARLGACSSQSQIGSVTVAAGPGSEPLNLTGAVFLTGPYEGAPFGLSIAVPAQAGPIDLGAINIRAGIDINPTTTALSIVSGPIPQSLAGIPLQIKSLDLDIDREGFMVNPTDCRPWTIDASLSGAQGASANAAEHFQAASCAKLPFKPKLTAVTNAKTTRLGGAYVHIKLAAQAGQANVGKVKLDFPKALPSRLTTLQGSCREAAFKADPARCPASSDLGTGVLTTPFMRSPLTGPLYLVSHGSRALPDLDAVMQAEGVTLILTGTTGFSGGISSDAFRSLPDAPISTLDLMFPAGPSSAFAANKNLCNRVLAMPAELTGQNGAVIKQTDTIAVSGCPRAKARRASRRG